MTELSRRADNVVASTIGDTITPFAAALLTSAAVVTGHPELAPWAVPASAFAGSLGEHGYLLVRDTLRDKASRVDTWVDEVERATGTPAQEFIASHSKDDFERDFMGRVIEAVAGSRDAWKIRALARAFVQGAQDRDLVDETLMFVELLRELDAGHVRYLAAVKMTPRPSAGIVTERDVLLTDPGLRGAAPFLRRTLQRLDLIEGSAAVTRLTDLGQACVTWLKCVDAQGGPEEEASGG